MDSNTAALHAYSDCRLCPRSCGVNRLAGELGYCRENSQLRISSASLHMGEEPCVTGRRGSGTIFITGCNLGCNFCQNWDISLLGRGQPIDENGLVNKFLYLQKAGAENINLVTSTHVTPALVGGIKAARKKGLSIPILWNSSAYESDETFALLEGLIDIWLPDLKTLDSSISEKYLNARDYPETAEKAILHMLQESELRVNSRGIISSGVIIRHLVLPGHLEASRQVLLWFSEHARGRALLSLLTQYSPPLRQNSKSCPGRRISREENDAVRSWIDEFKIKDGYFQGHALSSAWL